MTDEAGADPRLEGVANIMLEQVVGTDALAMQKAHGEAHLQRQRLLNAALAIAIVVALAVAPPLVVWVWRWAL